jgi:undecaprenyl-diphosphatase
MLVMLAGLTAVVMNSTTVDHVDAATSEEAVEATAASQSAMDWNLSITQLGNSETILALTILAVAVLAMARHWRGALFVTVAVVMTQAVVEIAKLVVERPRPNDALVNASGFSFPSGHAATSVALYGGIALIAARSSGGSRQWAVPAGAVILALEIGFSRIDLGAHYPSDVVAGWLTGAIIVIAAWLAVSRVRPLQPAA